MNILVTNDDGIFAPGIISLANALSRSHHVQVIAPEREQSATGHAITMHKPLRVNTIKSELYSGEAYSITGTPADCVKMGIDIILKEKPDLVFSGINRGPNLGTDIIYSGTVSAAVEGVLMGIPSIAISVNSYDEVDYTKAAEFSLMVAKKIEEFKPDKDTLLNINVPNTEHIKGVKITELGIRKYKDNYVKRKDPREKEYYWLAGELIEGLNSENTDISVVNNDYISITPIKLDLTNRNMIDRIIKWDISFENGGIYE